MKLFKLTLIGDWQGWYDIHEGFVVAASSEDGARALAAEQAGDERPDTWKDPTKSTCEEIAKRTSCPVGIVLASFRAG